MKKTSFNWRNVVAIAICSVVMMAFTACETEKDDEIIDKDASISMSNKNDAKQSAFADELSTGQGVTFTAKEAWSASVKGAGSQSSSDVSWIKLTLNGVEKYSGDAGTYTLVITVETNYTGAKREATVEIVCGTDRISITVTQDGKTKGGEAPVQNPVKLTSPISVNTTLKNLGLPIDYVFEGNDYLQVTGTAVLTIEPGVTIQFTHTGRNGGIRTETSATIKAIGTASQRITFIGAVEAKGSWSGIYLQSNTDNQFAYCDFLNVGRTNRQEDGAMYLTRGAKVGITHCKFTNGFGYGLNIADYGGVCQISAFNNNVFEGFELSPVMINENLKQLEKFDMTSDLTKNNKPYIDVYRTDVYMNENVTLNQTTVPYYLKGTLALKNTLTINEGVTLYMSDGGAIAGSTGKLIINGTATKKVTITRMPDIGNYYWGNLQFDLPGSVIKHCIIEYGGKHAQHGMVYAASNFTDLTLDNVAINNSNTYGFTFYYTVVDKIINHSNVTFSNNRDGNVNRNGKVSSHF